MQQAQKQGYDLQRLITSLKGQTDAEIEKYGREYYAERFLDNARNGQRETHDGQVLYFWESRFNHSCFMSPDKVRIDRARVERLMWVLPIIEGKIADTECFTVANPYQGRPDNRLYIMFPEKFVVWLEPRDNGGWTYSTHYTAEMKEIRGYQRRGAKIWEF